MPFTYITSRRTRIQIEHHYKGRLGRCDWRFQIIGLHIDSFAFTFQLVIIALLTRNSLSQHERVNIPPSTSITYTKTTPQARQQSCLHHPSAVRKMSSHTAPTQPHGQHHPLLNSRPWLHPHRQEQRPRRMTSKMLCAPRSLKLKCSQSHHPPWLHKHRHLQRRPRPQLQSPTPTMPLTLTSPRPSQTQRAALYQENGRVLHPLPTQRICQL